MPDKAPRKASPRKARQAKNESTASAVSPNEPDYDAYSRILSDLDDRITKLEQLIASHLGIAV